MKYLKDVTVSTGCPYTCNSFAVPARASSYPSRRRFLLAPCVRSTVVGWWWFSAAHGTKISQWGCGCWGGGVNVHQNQYCVPHMGVHKVNLEVGEFRCPLPCSPPMDTSPNCPPKVSRPCITWGMGGGGVDSYWDPWLVSWWARRCITINLAAKSAAHSGHLTQSHCLYWNDSPTPIIRLVKYAYKCMPAIRQVWQTILTILLKFVWRTTLSKIPVSTSGAA